MTTYQAPLLTEMNLYTKGKTGFFAQYELWRTIALMVESIQAQTSDPIPFAEIYGLEGCYAATIIAPSELELLVACVLALQYASYTPEQIAETVIALLPGFVVQLKQQENENLPDAEATLDVPQEPQTIPQDTAAGDGGEESPLPEDDYSMDSSTPAKKSSRK